MRLTIIALVLFVAAPSLAQRRVVQKTPLQMQRELSAILADVATVEGKVQNLQGDFRTMKAVQSKLDSIKKRLTRLIAAAPAQVQPVVVVQLPAQHPQVVITPPAEPTRPVAPPAPVGPVAMDSSVFGSLYAQIKGESFSDSKLNVLRTASSSHYFTVSQIKRILSEFSFSKEKLAAVRIVKNKLVDDKNVFQLYDAFTFQSDKKELRKILGR